MSDHQNDDDFEALRERMREEIGKPGVTLASVARRAGIPDSTLSAWMGGTYKGNNARVANSVRVFLSATESLASAGAGLPAPVPFTRTPTSSAIMGVFEYAQATADLGVVVGGAGVGKTFSATRYAETRPNVWLLTCDPSLRKAHGVLGYVADALGVTETRSDKVSRAVAARLAGTQGLLILDEAQHLTTEGLDQVRSLHDRAKAGMVIMGNEGLWARLDGGGRRAQFAQLFSRVGMRVKKDKPTVADIEAILDAAGIEASAPRKLLRAIAGKPGALRAMLKTLRLAQMVTGDGLVPLNEGDIQEAYERLAGAV